MKKLLLIFIFLLSECGFQPIYINKSLDNVEFFKITLEGDADINRKIVESLSFKENELQDTLNSLLIKSSYIISETSKNSKGQVESYKSQIILSLIIKDNNKVIESKNFSKEFSYNTKDNKFELVRYQNEVKENLIFKIIEDIILYMNI
tara:strand:+ start:837 stop:1283 length:447 start_codon:yes stop_codon:yes gene_type:complete